MKIQIRQGIFETNSSSEHSITIMPQDKYTDWKLGKLYARIKYTNEADNCWGNFWSRMKVLDFTDDFERVTKNNKNVVRNYVIRELKDLEEWKEKCLSHKKSVEKILNPEEIEKLSDEEYHEYEDKLYEDQCYRFDEKSYNEEKTRLNSLTPDNFTKEVGLIRGIWFTYEQFMEDLHIDCQSPYEHVDIDDNIHIIGKYFHS